MMRRIAAAMLATLLLGLASGCVARPGVKVLNTATVQLDVGKSRTSVAAHVGDLLTLELPPVELAGYGWQVFMHDSRYLEQKSEIAASAAAGGRATIRFLAVRHTPTRTTVRFLLVKLDGAKETNPVDGHDAVFTID